MTPPHPEGGWFASQLDTRPAGSTPVPIRIEVYSSLPIEDRIQSVMAQTGHDRKWAYRIARGPVDPLAPGFTEEPPPPPPRDGQTA